jgi:hypothetical protein
VTGSCIKRCADIYLAGHIHGLSSSRKNPRKLAHTLDNLFQKKWKNHGYLCVKPNSRAINDARSPEKLALGTAF